MLLGPGTSPVAKRTLAVAILGLAGTAVTAPPVLAQASGFASASSSPAIVSIACASGCADSGSAALGSAGEGRTVTVEQGGSVTLGGRLLDRASAVVFLGARGSRDDVRVRARARDAANLDVKVPAKARSGQVALVTAGGVAAQSRGVSVRVVKPAATDATAPLPTPVLRPIAGVDQLDAGFVTRRAGRGASAASIAYVSHAPATVTVRVDVVRIADGLSIFSDARSVAAEQQQTIAWDGRGDAGVALDGKYDVRVSTAPESAPRTTAAPDTGAAAGGAAPALGGSPPPSGAASVGGFTFVGAVFPVRAAHSYGHDGAAFGAGRGGRSHAGQDVLAKCGSPIVAARGGTVKHKGVQSAAGNYVVISDPVTGEDHGYMHLAESAIVARGARVETGQQIATVGMTGNATACLLHFELWTAPGWYSGGSAIDPLATLKGWDRLG